MIDGDAFGPHLAVRGATVDLGLCDPPAHRLHTDTVLPSEAAMAFAVVGHSARFSSTSPTDPLTDSRFNHLRHDATLSTRKEAAANPAQFMSLGFLAL